MKDSNSKSLDPNLMETQNMEDYYYTGNEEERNLDDFNFININLDPEVKPEPRKESNLILITSVVLTSFMTNLSL